jgi:hypothetical protein
MTKIKEVQDLNQEKHVFYHGKDKYGAEYVRFFDPQGRPVELSAFETGLPEDPQCFVSLSCGGGGEGFCELDIDQIEHLITLLQRYMEYGQFIPLEDLENQRPEDT